MSKIIDTHHHLWDLKKLSYPWLMNHVDTFLGNYDKIRKNYLLNDFVKDYNSNRNKFRNIENLKLSNINLSDDQIRQKNLLTNSYIPIKYNSDLFVAKNNYVEKYDEWKAFDPLFQKNFIGLSMEIFKND